MQFLSEVMEMVVWLGHGTFATKATGPETAKDTEREREKEKGKKTERERETERERGGATELDAK